MSRAVYRSKNGASSEIRHTNLCLCSLGTTVVVKGLMSRPAHGQGRNSPDRQFYYINGRPFTPSKVSQLLRLIAAIYMINRPS